MTYIFLIVFIILIAIYFYKGFKNTQDIRVNTINLNSESTTPNSSTLRILHISDMHLEHISITPTRLYEQLKDQEIDMIALTGDFLDRKRSIPKLVPYLESFRQLNPTYGTFAVFGNHDYVLRGKNFEQLRNVLQAYDVQTMENENRSIDIDGFQLNIIGIDDFSTNRSKINQSYQDITNGYNLVLTHDPNIVLKMGDYHFDYLLSGHFHGGQIYWPKPYHLIKMGKLVRMNMVKGLHYHEGKPFYISEGLGQTGVNVRIGSRPEITFHHLKISKDEKSESKTIAG